MRKSILAVTVVLFGLNTVSATGIPQFAQGTAVWDVSGLSLQGNSTSSGSSSTGMTNLQQGIQENAQQELSGGLLQGFGGKSSGERDSLPRLLTYRPSSIEEVFLSRTKLLNIKLKQFGYDFFSGKPRLSLSIPVDKSYVLGPGDELFLYVVGNPPGINLSRITRLVVDRQGKVYIPGLGVFYVWGMTLGEAEKRISQALGANIKLTVGRLRTFPVYVSGEVRRPGAVIVTGVNTVIDALMMAGGIKKSGTLRDITVTRKTPGGVKRIHIDFYRLLLEGKPVDMRLRDGDVIFVKSVGKVAGIGGKVKRPAIYEITGKETLRDLIQMAGGLLPSSYKYKVVLQRYVNNQLLEVKQGSLDDDRFMSQKVHDGDLLIIKQVVSIPRNAIMVDGYTPYPGLYEYRPGLTLSQFLKPDFFLPDSNTRFALIERRWPEGSTPKYIAFSPEAVLKHVEDFPLEPRDRIIFYRFGQVNNVDFNKVKDVFIVTGKIKYPGVYAYRKGIKLSDVLTSELITEDTNLEYAEIDRRDPQTLDIMKIIQFKPKDILEGKKDITLHKLDTVRFFPRYAYKPIRVSGEIESSYWVPYHDGITLSEALSHAKFRGNIRDLKVLVFREEEPQAYGMQLNREFKKDFLGTREKQLYMESLKRMQKADISTENPVTSKNWQGEKFGNFLVPEEFNSADGNKGRNKREVNEVKNNFLKNSINGDNKEREVEQRPEVSTNVASFFLYDVLVKQQESGFKLQPGDRLVIVKVRPEETVEKVRVIGYVKYPGVYSISEKTTLYDVLKKAGGFLPNAYPQGIVILRRSIAELQKQRLQKAISLMRQQLEKEEAGIMQSDLTPGELKARQAAFEAKRRLLEELQRSQVAGRIAGVIVPKNLEKLKDSPYNIILNDGDQIFIPKVPGSILVFGEVYNPSALVYVKGMTVRDYIAEAGGLTRDADKENIFVIKANGSVVTSGNVGGKKFDWDSSTNRIILGRNDILDYKLQPGDSVIIPTKVHVPVMWRPLIKDVMQIIYQGAITVYTITKL